MSAAAAYRAYLDAHRKYAEMVGTWRELFNTPRFRRARDRQSAAWRRYRELVKPIMKAESF